MKIVFIALAFMTACDNGRNVDAGATQSTKPVLTGEASATSAPSAAPNDICAKAEACGVKVFAALGNEKFNADKELGNPRAPKKCKQALDALREMTNTLGKTTPAECNAGMAK